jgi:hypothetical protein
VTQVDKSELIAAHNEMVGDAERLVDALAEAYQAYRAEDGALRGQFLAMHAVITFLQDLNVAPHLQEPLMELFGKLADNEMKRLRRAEGRTGQPKAIKRAAELATANAAVTVMLDEGGKTLRDAFAIVVRAFGAGLTAAELKNYRENSGARRTQAGEREFYHVVLSAIRSQPQEKRVEAALDFLTKQRD